MIVGWVHIWLYVVHQYFQRHVAAAVRVWLVLVTCGRPLVGHSDWINSHQKHAVDWVVCSCTRPHAGPRVSDIASRHHEKTAASVWPRPRPGTGKRSDVTPLLNDGWRSGRKKRERRRGTAVCAPLWNPPFLPHREETSVDLIWSCWTQFGVICQRSAEVKTGGVCVVCSAAELLWCRDNQTHAYFRWGQYQRWGGGGGGGGRLVIGTDCVLWLRRRVLLGRERGSIWAEFWGVLAHLNMVGTQKTAPWRHAGNARNLKPRSRANSLLLKSSPLPWLQHRILSPHIHSPPTVFPPLHFVSVHFFKVDPSGD